MKNKTKQQSTSIVIPGRNCERTLYECLSSAVVFLENGSVDEILFVDDGSTDNSRAIANTFPVVVVESSGGGPGAARNSGWRKAQGDLVWFLDSDCIAEETALSVLLKHFRSASVGGVGGSYANATSSSLLSRLIHEEIMVRHARMSRTVNFLGGYNVIYRRSVLEEVGGFDERYFNGPCSPGAEDADLAYRVIQKGYELHFDPESIVAHFHQTRLRRYVRTQMQHGYWRARLHLFHRQQGLGDSYSNVMDNGQPVIAVLLLLLMPFVMVGDVLVLISVLFLFLVIMPLPMTGTLLLRRKKTEYMYYLPLSIIRAFVRAIGLIAGCNFLLTQMWRKYARRDKI